MDGQVFNQFVKKKVSARLDDRTSAIKLQKWRNEVRLKRQHQNEIFSDAGVKERRVELQQPGMQTRTEPFQCEKEGF